MPRSGLPLCIWLEFLRSNYRIENHPDQWDVQGVYSYVPLYAVALSDTAVLFQMGKEDSFYPNARPMAPVKPFFNGTRRAVIASEFLGEYLTLKRILDTLGTPIELEIHNAGHEFVFSSARDFLKENCY